jgi:hypothetical protein
MKVTTVLPILFLVFSVQHASAELGAAKAKMKVVSAVAVTKVSDLLFSEATAGAASETVAADNSETAQNASFTITGEPNRAISITLPTDGLVKMMTANGTGTEAEVAVNAFTSSAPTAIDGNGAVELFVGATRDALLATQVPGDYEGDFVVDVVYQ